MIAALLLAASLATPVVLDTDIGGDYDDVGALALLHKLADRGECDIKAVAVCNLMERSVPMVELLNRHYGRPEIPIGVTKSNYAKHIGLSHDWSKTLVDKYPHPRYARSADAPDAVSVYRKVLEEADDGSLVICAIGFMTNLAELMRDPDVKTLVSRKVKRLVSMAGCERRGREFNLYCDFESAKLVLTEWPTPIVFSPFELGNAVITGKHIMRLEGESPIKDAFVRPRMSWDETAVWLAVRGCGDSYRTARGRMMPVAGTDETEFQVVANGPHEMASANKTPEALAEELERLMIEPSHGISADKIRVRDPFILADEKTKTYYLYNTTTLDDEGRPGVNVYTSRDLKGWFGPRRVMTAPEWVKRVWAPEVHVFKGAYYMFVTLKEAYNPAHPVVLQGPEGWDPGLSGEWASSHWTYVFRSARPEGPFEMISEGPVTPKEWVGLDGTLAVQDGKPYLVFTHDWAQIADGTIELAPLREDLSGRSGPPTTLFRASEVAPGTRRGVTDGPFVYRSKKSGKLFITWSTQNPTRKLGTGYCVVATESASGRIEGPWRNHTVIYDENGGHGMIFEDFEGNLRFALHGPNTWGAERLKLYDFEDDGERISIR